MRSAFRFAVGGKNELPLSTCGECIISRLSRGGGIHLRGDFASIKLVVIATNFCGFGNVMRPFSYRATIRPALRQQDVDSVLVIPHSSTWQSSQMK